MDDCHSPPITKGNSDCQTWLETCLETWHGSGPSLILDCHESWLKLYSQRKITETRLSRDLSHDVSLKSRCCSVCVTFVHPVAKWQQLWRHQDSMIATLLCTWAHHLIITRDSEVIMFSSCVFVCLFVCVCVVVYVCRDVCPDDLTMKDLCHTSNILHIVGDV